MNPTIVRGVRCPRGHLNHPDALFCCVDGGAMIQCTQHIVRGPRPSLGVLIFDRGETYTLDADCRIGRRPGQTPGEADAPMHVIEIDDDLRSISRLHLEVRLVEWDVTVIDRGSLNGTFVMSTSDAMPTQLQAEMPTALAPGDRVLVGSRSFVFESPHLQAQAVSA